MLNRIAALIWASPNSLLGLVLAGMVIFAGGRAKREGGTLEVTFRRQAVQCGNLAKSLRFRGITFGHVIIAVTEEELERLRAHERVHVRQYERWGILFLPAYLASSVWQVLMGRDGYWDNYFEVQARRESQPEKFIC